MASKSRGVDARLAHVQALRQDLPAAGAVAALRTALDDASNLVVAEAAGLVAEARLADLAPALVAAFERFMIEPETSDKRCRAKIAIVQALNHLEYPEADVFLRGFRHVQEPSWNSPDDDAAAPLRGDSAFGLVRINYPGVLHLLVDLLLDRARAARAAAVQALGASGAAAAVPLLRFKACIGDKQEEVRSERFAALLRLDPAASVPFVAGFLEAGSERTREGAALALGESRCPEALAPLKHWWEARRRQSLEEVVLLAISLLRLPAALDYLFDLLGREDASAPALVDALAIHRHNPRIRQRTADAVARKKNPALQARFERKFNKE